MKILAATLMVFCTAPIWFYLLYQILVRVEASEVMWLLYWVYVPVQFFVSLVVKMMECEK